MPTLTTHIPDFGGNVDENKNLFFHDPISGNDLNEIYRLHNNKRYNDLFELGQSDIKMMWEFLAYILKEKKFFCRINNEKDFFKILIKQYLPENLFILLNTRTTL